MSSAMVQILISPIIPRALRWFKDKFLQLPNDGINIVASLVKDSLDHPQCHDQLQDENNRFVIHL